ncbi:MAG: OmpH family outer membrane protein, partial [Kordia sp.]
MKKLLVLGIAVLAFYSCEKPVKIGFVDNTELINEYQEKKDLEAVFTKRVEGFTKRKDSLSQMFNLELKQAQQKAAKASPKKQQELSVQIQQLGERLDQQIKIEQNR